MGKPPYDDTIRDLCKMLPAKAGFKFKSKIPDFERGKEKFLTTPIEIHRDRHEYMEYFEDKAKASLRAKIEPDIPPMAGGKRGRFAKVSIRKSRN